MGTSRRMIYTITVAFCPASQLAISLYKNRFIKRIPDKSYVVMGHYPINKEKNNRDIKMISEAHGIEVLDPGYDMGSAQSQWWALQQVGAQDGDYWINLDPDSLCDFYGYDQGWPEAMKTLLDNNPDCIVGSCMSPMVQSFLKERNIKLTEISYDSVRYGIALNPVPFNLSMWRYSFFNEIGGIPQVGEKWGEVEGPVFHQAHMRGKYHAYLLDYMEDESGKFMQDRQLLEYKDLYMRTDGPNRFVGSYEEYLRWKYPQLLEIDTKIPDGTVFQ